VVAGVVTALAGVLTLIYLPAHPEMAQHAGEESVGQGVAAVDDAA
jgi:branched-subunit amino acid ABC-type transport system permease component